MKILEKEDKFKIVGTKVLIKVDQEPADVAKFVNQTLRKYNGLVSAKDKRTVEVDIYTLISYAISNLF